MGDRVGRWAVPAAGLALCLAVLGAVCLPYLPHPGGMLGVDYGFWLPNLLAGDFWHRNAPFFAVPWFNPAECGGAPLHADPQGAYLSLPQFLTFVVPPVRALQWAVLAYGACGFLGAYGLAAWRFGCSRPAALLAGILFGVNGFFSARMLVGHLSFATWSLVPAMALCALGPAAGRRAEAARWLGLGALLAACVQAGMTVLMLPALFCLALLAVIHAMAVGGGLRAAARRIGGGGALAILLCAGKLAAVGGLMANLPRDAYPLPGFPNIFLTAWTALRCLFFWPDAAMTEGIVNSALRFELHEFDYRVGPVPLLLLGVAAWRMWRQRGASAPNARRRMQWQVLGLLLALPLALNTYAIFWTPFLKSIPILRSASSLMRWFAAYMLPAAIGAGVALDYLTQGRRWVTSGAGIALTCLCLLATDRSFYGPAGIGGYDPRPIQAGWMASARTGHTPAIRAVVIPPAADGSPDMSTNRGNRIAWGQSPLLCYDPIFGYRLEAFRQGSLHPGPVMDETPVGDRVELNLKNPACYVFPGANGCAAGDTFTASQRAAALDFAGWRPFAFLKPWWARVADWVGIVALVACLGTAAFLCLPRRAARA